MISEFLIFLREALEGSLIVAVLLAAVRSQGQDRLARAVWAGVIAAVAAAAGIGAAAYGILHAYDGTRLQAALEGTTDLVAAGVLTYMTFWMRQESRHLRQGLTDRTRRALEGRGQVALALVAFLTVAREGVETVVFGLAIALSSPAWQVAVGAGMGLAAGLALSSGAYGWGRRLHLGRFFTVMGALLMVCGAGLLADGVESYQALGWLPGAGAAVWNTGRFLPEQSLVGDLLHSFLGYAQAPTWLQVALYGMYLALVLPLWLRRSPAPVRTAAAPSQGASS